MNALLQKNENNPDKIIPATNSGKILKNETIRLSVIIPVYNEAAAIKIVIPELIKELDELSIDYEIIAVNDGCTDGCNLILESLKNLKIINHPYNKGYGASLKSGAKKAKHDWLLFFDADGQHKAQYIKDFLEHAHNHDLIIGARQGYKGPLLRQPGKKIIHLVANYLAETKIPDLNCGFRLVKKEYFLKFNHLFPNNFSLSTTSTLAFLKEGLSVKYLPITINKRLGRSTVKISDGFKTLLLALRLIMLFSPLKIFLPLSVVGFITSTIWMGYIFVSSHFLVIPKSGGFLFIASLLIFLFGLLADQIAAVRREIKRDLN